MTIDEQLKAPWVQNFKHIEADAKEFVRRMAVEPFQYIDCLATPSGSHVHGFVKLYKLAPNIYRMIYIVQAPGSKVLQLGEGEALFEGEAQKFEQKYGSPSFEKWREP